MKQNILTLLLLVCISPASAQSYTSYFTGDSADVTTTTSFGACLMGGGTEHDEAMRWFLSRAGGGDIVVIRATGTNGYNSYLYSGLGVTVNSVETIVIPSVTAANDPYVRQQLRNAEAIWIAGGDQFDYISYWKNSAVDSALNDHMNIKQAPIGGTSAGMAILGSRYFSAANGTITSAQALADPFHSNLTLGHNDFLNVPFMQDVITDTHYDNPDRRGRHITFLSRITNDFGIRSFGIACDEYTAVCIDSAGKARVYGEYPAYDDNAYFIQVNCIAPFGPETCTASTPLTWDRNNAAVKVYSVKGDLNGTNYFHLTDWETGSGGTWENWYVLSGQLYTAPGIPADCSGTGITEEIEPQITIHPNPSAQHVFIKGISKGTVAIGISTPEGRLVLTRNTFAPNSPLDVSGLADGIYFLELKTKELSIVKKIVVQK